MLLTPQMMLFCIILNTNNYQVYFDFNIDKKECVLF